jgi:hypothetical protein
MADDTVTDLAEHAYQAYRAWSPDRSLPPWEAIPSDVKRSWRLLAYGYRPVDAVELPLDPNARPKPYHTVPIPTLRRERMPTLRVVSEPPSREPRQYLYFIRAETGHIKIGISNSPTARLSALQTSSPVPLELLGLLCCVDARAAEARLHSHFAHLRVQGEWFTPGGDLLDYIAALELTPALPY